MSKFCPLKNKNKTKYFWDENVSFLFLRTKIKIHHIFILMSKL
jgi:hypothetical protein